MVATRNVAKRVFKKKPYKKRGITASAVKSIVAKQLAKVIEKKVADPIYTPVGQTIAFGANNNTTTSGWAALDLNPNISQGVAANQRIGNKLDIVSGHIQVQLNGGSSQYLATKFKIMLILKTDVANPESANATTTKLLLPNVFTGLIDTNSSQNVGQRANYKILRTISATLPAAQTQTSMLMGVPTSPAVGTKNVSMGFKFKKPLEQVYDDNGLIQTTRNSLVLLFLGGNDSNVSQGSGIEAKFYAQFYYTDA